MQPIASPSRDIQTLNPKDREIQDLLTRREFDSAEKLIRERLEKEPKNADAPYWLGVLYYFQGKVGLAVENLKKALSLDPGHTDAAVCLSVLYNDIGKYDDAKRVFEQANQSIIHKRTIGDVRIDKKFAVKHLELADLYFRYRRYDEAIVEYTNASRLDPGTLEIRIRRAKVYAKKGFISRSIQELEQLKREHPSYAPARLQLGLTYYSQGNLLDSELEWEGVLTLDSSNREANAYLAMARKARGNQAETRQVAPNSVSPASAEL